MNTGSFPPAGMSYLVQKVPNEDASDIRRNWTGNDENDRHHHGKVPLIESPLRLRLHWRKSSRDPSCLIGIFDLDLHALLRAGYIRPEPGSENEVRLRFYHGLDNVIYIQVNSKKAALPIGRVS
jgi:hypothetical protein